MTMKQAELAARRERYALQRRIDAERRQKQRQQEAKARAKRERQADAARGLAPEPYRDFRVPMAFVPDLLVVWELTQVCL